MTRRRLDVELVRRGLARSRTHANDLVSAGRVTVAGWPASKASTMIEESVAVEVAASSNGGEDYASRGAYKLLGALDHFEPSGLSVGGRRCLDAGASTGGFTDVLLRRGAAAVIAVDVGYGQLAWRLRQDERVRVLDRTNVRSVTPTQIGGPVDVAVADLSFISLRLVLPSVLSCMTTASQTYAPQDASDPEPDVVVLVKPQFEVGKSQLGKGGVVRDPDLRRTSVQNVADVAHSLGWGTAGVVASSLPGPAGNVEYVLWLRRSASAADPAEVERAVMEGPA